MTSERASAYGRVMKTIDELGDGLGADRRAVIREAADAMVFCSSERPDAEAREAMATLQRLLIELVDDDALDPDTAERLASDVEACGPVSLPAPVA